MYLEEILFHSFGFAEFRPGQKDVITSLLNKKNTVGVLPTGTGKSLCYQFIGQVLEGHVLIVSPLLSLMQDQVEQMRAKGDKRVIAINSFLTSTQKRTVIQSLNSYKYIFISPEMLQVDWILSKLKELEVALFVIDEAHCISQWGYDFRTDYQKLGEIRKKLQSPLTLALTATATQEVLKDITRILEIDEATIFETSVDRPNISMKIETYEDLKAKQQAVIQHLQSLPGPGIIYFSSKKLAEQTVDFLKANRITKVMAYHGGMTHEDRILIQQQFINGQIDYICATSAFGMGINKENIRFVIHFHMPLQIESYLQEIGRAGRDGKQSIAVLLYSRGDESLAIQLAEGELPDLFQINWLIEQIPQQQNYEQLSVILSDELRVRGGFSETQWRVTSDYIKTHFEKNLSLDQIMDKFKSFVTIRKKIKIQKIFEMVHLITSSDCRRKTILNYFGESSLSSHRSNCCDQCGIHMEDFYSKKMMESSKVQSVDWVCTLTNLLTPVKNDNLGE